MHDDAPRELAARELDLGYARERGREIEGVRGDGMKRRGVKDVCVVGLEDDVVKHRGLLAMVR